MNIPQIQALKRELEVALTQAFADFATRTGLAVEGVGMYRAMRETAGGQRTEVTQVVVTLERL